MKYGLTCQTVTLNLICTSHYNHQVQDVSKTKQAYCHDQRDVKIVQLVSLIVVITLPLNIQALNIFDMCPVKCKLIHTNDTVIISDDVH